MQRAPLRLYAGTRSSHVEHGSIERRDRLEPE